MTTYVLSSDDIAVGDVVTSQLEKMWGWYLAGGIISVIFGFFVISWRHATVYAAIYFASAFFIAGGVFEIVGSVRMARQRWLNLVFGLFWVGAGIVGFVWPHITIFVIAVLIGWSFLVLGIFDIVSSLQNHHLPYWWIYLIRGLVALGRASCASGTPAARSRWSCHDRHHRHPLRGGRDHRRHLVPSCHPGLGGEEAPAG